MDAVRQGVQAERRSRLLRGPLAAGFEQVMNEVHERLQRLGPHFTPEYLMPFNYQSREVAKRELSGTERVQLSEITQLRNNRLHELADEVVMPTIERQELALGTLAEPPYCRQERAAMLSEGWRSCTNACFRMVFTGIVGWSPSQHAVNDALKEHYGTTTVDDEVYCGVFASEAFKQVSDRHVATFEMIGADLDVVGGVANKLAERSGAEAYCMVNMASTSVTEAGVWHSAILLGTEGEEVILHDPSDRDGAPFKRLDKTEFAERWTTAYTRARFVVAK